MAITGVAVVIMSPAITFLKNVPLECGRQTSSRYVSAHKSVFYLHFFVGYMRPFSSSIRTGSVGFALLIRERFEVIPGFCLQSLNFFFFKVNSLLFFELVFASTE